MLSTWKTKTAKWKIPWDLHRQNLQSWFGVPWEIWILQTSKLITAVENNDLNSTLTICSTDLKDTITCFQVIYIDELKLVFKSVVVRQLFGQGMWKAKARRFGIYLLSLQKVQLGSPECICWLRKYLYSLFWLPSLSYTKYISYHIRMLI